LYAFGKNDMCGEIGNKYFICSMIYDISNIESWIKVV